MEIKISEARNAYFKSPWVQTAIEEDQSKIEAEVPPHLVETIDTLLSLGKPIERNLRSKMEAVFESDFRFVRICIGAEVDKVIEMFCAGAFCAANGIFLRSDAVDVNSEPGIRVLAHELAHLSIGNLRNGIRFWNPKGHWELTREQVRNYFRGAFSGLLVELSIKMDAKPRHYYHMADYWLSKKMHKFPLPSGGPDHGEGGDPTINRERQSQYIDEAVEAYRQLRDIKGSPATRVMRKLDKSPLILTVASHLGDALHVAQDRGSHGEGAKDKGHNDPRYIELHVHKSKPGWDWDPDDININDEGRWLARKNTTAVFDEFKRKVGPDKNNWLDSLIFKL